MYDKNYCRNYINERKQFLNLTKICKHLNVQQPHLSQFLKSDNYNMFMNIENLNKIIKFIEELG